MVFAGSALPPLSGPCAFAESAQLIWLAHGFRLLAFLGDALLPLLGDFTRFSYGLVPVVAICPLRKQKSRSFCNFFAIRGSFFNLVKRKRPLSGGLPAALYLDLRPEGSQQLPIAKKLQFESNFCFQSSLDDFLAVPWAG